MLDDIYFRSSPEYAGTEIKAIGYGFKSKIYGD